MSSQNVAEAPFAKAEEMVDRMAIRDLLENWAIWRDAGDWDRFATVWHDDGYMNATWCEASAEQFIENCRNTFDAGNISLHNLGGSSIQVNGTRAIAQTKMQLTFPIVVHGIRVIETCLGRFADALEKRNDKWGMVYRQPIYELDWLTLEDPSAELELDPGLLNSYPMGYRHMGYALTHLGVKVRTDLPGTRGPEVESLMERMNRWLAGEPASCLRA